MPQFRMFGKVFKVGGLASHCSVHDKKHFTRNLTWAICSILLL